MNRSIVWSYGGGTQSAAIAILIANKRIPKPEVAIIANTQREATETWEYTFKYVLPLFDKIGLSLHIANARGNLYYKPDDTLPLIPAYTRKGKGRLRLFCSAEWKRDVVMRYLRSLGYGPKRPVIQWLGLSLDEVERMKKERRQWCKEKYPLIDLGMYRGECVQTVLDYGWPYPPKSSCWMCPHRSNNQWLRLKRLYPDDWSKATALDRYIRKRDGQHDLFVHRSGTALNNADLSSGGQLDMFDGCDSGYCWV